MLHLRVVVLDKGVLLSIIVVRCVCNCLFIIFWIRFIKDVSKQLRVLQFVRFVLFESYLTVFGKILMGCVFLFLLPALWYILVCELVIKVVLSILDKSCQ